MLRILLADDHSVVRRIVRNFVQSEAGWEVCAEATNGREAVAMTAAEHPDVVVLDLSMPDLNGLQAATLTSPATIRSPTRIRLAFMRILLPARTLLVQLHCVPSSST